MTRGRDRVRRKDVFVDRRTTVSVILVRDKGVRVGSWGNFHVSRILETSKYPYHLPAMLTGAVAPLERNESRRGGSGPWQCG